ncbi:MAG: hypothetical protein KAR37_12765 [Alphaproteobacteria bacterium]|nr:hypothetical protein [Alphaproteobacteria bacterium]
MHRKIRWLKASYLAGAVADFGTGVLALIPSRMGQTEITYPMGLAATLMFGWSLLLIWAYRKPVERKGVLVITIAAIPGLLASGLYAVAAGIFPFTKIIPSSIVGIGLIALMGYSYLGSRDLEADSGSDA